MFTMGVIRHNSSFFNIAFRIVQLSILIMDGLHGGRTLKIIYLNHFLLIFNLFLWQRKDLVIATFLCSGNVYSSILDKAFYSLLGITIHNGLLAHKRNEYSQ